MIEGDWAANAATLSLTVAAIAAAVAGLKALLGHGRADPRRVTMVLVGNPFSGVGSAPELLPEPVGGLGQLLPPARAATCCAAPGSSTAPPPAVTSRCCSRRSAEFAVRRRGPGAARSGGAALAAVA